MEPPEKRGMVKFNGHISEDDNSAKWEVKKTLQYKKY